METKDGEKRIGKYLCWGFTFKEGRILNRLERYRCGEFGQWNVKKVCRFCKSVIIIPFSWKWLLFQILCWYPWAGVIPLCMIFSQEFNYSFQSYVGFIFLQVRFVWCYAYISLYNNLLLCFQRVLIFMRIYLFFSKKIHCKSYFSFSRECFMLACY